MTDPAAVDVQQVPLIRGERGELERLANAAAQVERATRSFERREPFNRWRAPKAVAEYHGWPMCARPACGIHVAAGVARVDIGDDAYHVECLYLELRARTRESQQLAA